MSRGYRLAAIISLAALLGGAVPASAAPVGGWSLFDGFSPLDWVDLLLTQARSWIEPSGLRLPEAGNWIAPSGTQNIWGQEGSTMDPLGRSAATPSDGGTWIDPLARQ